MTAAATPLTLVSGYLGSGKTTLINHVLRSGALGRAAVVVNDFGSVNIDAALIRSSGADTLELTNGCICCQITDDVQRTMGPLAARDDLDHVVCEVSGIGNPAQLGAWRTFPGFRPGGVVVCVDAGVTARRLRDEYVADIVRAQIAAADLLVVTKADAVSDLQLSQTVEACEEIAGKVPVEIVRDDDWAPVLRALGEVTARAATAEHSAERSEAHPAVHSTLTVEVPGPVEVSRIVAVLRAHAPHLKRAKGIVQDAAGAWVAVQLAGGVVTTDGVDDAPPAGSASGTAADPASGPGPDSASDSASGAAQVPSEAAGRSTLVLIAAGPDAEHALERAAHDLALCPRAP